MGRYLPRFSRTPKDEPSASITWCEYMAALSTACDQGNRVRAGVNPGSPAWTRAGSGPDGTETVLLSERVRRRPDDETAHRLLGLVHLAHGQVGPAVRHLEIALRLVRGHARHAVGLADALQRQCEAAVLRLVLLRLHMRLGHNTRASALAQEIQAVL
jgi:hypothetical protein